MKPNLSNTAALAAVVLFSALVYPSAGSVDVQTPEDSILAKGFSAYMDGRDKQALSYFEEVVRINPHNTAAIKGLQKVKSRLREKDDIEQQKALRLAEAKYKEGRGFQKSGDMVGAIDSFHAALDAVPGQKNALNELKDIRAQMRKETEKRKLNLSQQAFARGVLAYLDRDWAKSYRIWSERSRIEPTNVRLANATARAEQNFQKMMLAEREDFYRRGGRAFYQQGLYARAENSWIQVLAIRGDDQEALEGKARAEDAILQAQGKGRDSKVHDLLEQGLEYYANQSWRRALETFNEIVRIDPEFDTAKEYIAMLNQKLTAVDYNPGVAASGQSWRPSMPSNRGENQVQISEKLGNFSQSRQELESQLKRDPSNIRVQQELDKVVKSQDEESERIYKDGLIAYSQGNRGLAIQNWNQVLVINPDHKKAAAALKKAKAEEERGDEGTPAQ